MPHAVDPFDQQDQQDEAEIARLLNGQSTERFDGEDLFNPDRQFELGEKADDAQDFESIGDDDLASEEDDAPRSDNHVEAQPVTNGHARGLDDEPAQEDGNFGDDLFGDDEPLPEDTTQEPERIQQVITKGGLALPSKQLNRIALPGSLAQAPHLQNGQAAKATSARDTPPADEPTNTPSPEPEAQMVKEEKEEEDEDPMAVMQRLLFQGHYQSSADPEATLEEFYDIWPTYEPSKTPRFTELFPPIPSHYNWKTPVKPPKALPPTKLSLDIEPDTERSFRVATSASDRLETAAEHGGRAVIYATRPASDDQQSEDSLGLDDVDEEEIIGGVSFRDLAVLCEDWETTSLDSQTSGSLKRSRQADSGVFMESEEDTQPDGLSRSPPTKRQKTSHFELKSTVPFHHTTFDDPEQTTARLAKRIVLDLNDPDLLIDEDAPKPEANRMRRAFAGPRGSRNAMTKDLSRRYNISNDEAYELLKENHQHKIRSTLGNVAIDHSMPAIKLQYPYYRVKLEPRELRSFHRPHFISARINKEIRFSKLRNIKRKHLRGRETKEIFSTTEDLSMGDNSSGLLLEYAEEMPPMLSNFGMGNRLVNYYRRKDEHDSSRPKEEIGETQVLLPQDRSPFANFGQVAPGELVPAIHNGLYRAPIFKHEGRPTDFLVVCSTTAENGSRFFLRNVENLHVVGQQFPSTEVPGEHSRKVTDAAKRRLRTLSYRVWKKWSERRGPPLTNHIVQAHLPGSDIAQNRGKMREFMKYEKNQGIWIPKDGEAVPSSDALRTWIRPEDICVLDSMQVGVQHLNDLGLRRDEEVNDDEDAKEGTNVELLLAPWATTKNFLNACQGKAMLQLHGEGDPTGRGEGFSFIKTSMKGGFRALGESIQERLDAKRLKENNGHSYNVARQQKAYDESIRRIWRAQNESLSSNLEHSDAEADVDEEQEDTVDRGVTPRTSFGTPATFARREDESVSQFSKTSANRRNQTLVVTRSQRNKYGELEDVPVTITNQRVIAAYKRAKLKEQSARIDPTNIAKTGDSDFDNMQIRAAQEEIARLERAMDRRDARERAKGILGSSTIAQSPSALTDEGGDGDDTAAPTPADGKPGKKSRKPKNTEGTGRRCANCGQVGHIKTNKKLCPMLNGTMKPEDAHTGFGGGGNAAGSFGAVGGGGLSFSGKSATAAASTTGATDFADNVDGAGDS